MRNSIFLLLAATALLSACKNKSQLTLSETSFKEEVSLLENLSFTFNKDLAPDSLLYQWDATQYIKFEPPIPGKFSWTNASVLTFSPESPLIPATSYKATFTDDLTKYAKQFSAKDLKEVLFKTPDTKLESALARWAMNEQDPLKTSAYIDLYFNYRINPAKLNEALAIEEGGTKYAFTLITSSSESKLTASVTGLKVEDRDYAFTVKIAPGILPERGVNATKDRIEASVELPSALALFINNIESEHDGAEGHIRLFTSQQPDTSKLLSFLSIEPKVKFKTEFTGDGLMITSEEFQLTQAYTIVVKQGFKGKLGGSLRDEYNTQVSFGQLQPSISFASRKAIYLSREGNKNVQIKIVGVLKVNVTISKIYENNLIASRNGYRGRNYYYDEEYGHEYEYDGYNYADYSMGDVIYESEIETKYLAKKGSASLFNFNFEDKLPEFKGIYYITIRSKDQYWLSEGRFVSLSDIGLIAKEGSDKVSVFVNSLKSAESLGNVSVSLYGNNNQLVSTAVTNPDGYAELPLKKNEFSGFKPALITARNGSDFNYMLFNNTHVETSRFEVGGKNSNVTGLDAFVYLERDIYRPGEKINMSVVVRDRKWNVPAEVPLKIKLLQPNGKELKVIRKNVNEQGSLESAFELSPAAITGSYHFEIYTANDILLTTKNVLVEEFMPDRIKVTADMNKEFYKPGDTAVLNINVMNYFGPPAADRNYEVEQQLKVKNFYSKKYPRYNYWISNRNEMFQRALRQGATDSEGNVKEEFAIDAGYDNMGLLQTDFFITVFDENGRPVSKKLSADIVTQDVFYGIGYTGYYYHATKNTIKYPLIALDKNGNVQNNVQAKVVVIKHEYHTVLSRYGNYYRYDSQREDKVVVDKVVVLNGETSSFSFTPATSGNYEIRVMKPGASSYYVADEFYCYGWGDITNTSFEVNNEGNIDIDLDKEKYAIGETAKLLFKAPFNGKMLVTVESDKVLEHFWLQTDKRSATASVSLKADYLPNVYVSATLIKPHEESDLPLTVAHGFKSIALEDASTKIPVQIFAEKQARSKTQQKVKVKAAPNSKITLAAVDEGILAVTGFSTPDPHKFFYQKRALEVESFDLYPLLFPEVKGSISVISSTGGDGELAKRLNPVQNKRVKLLSYWSGITDADGNAEANFEFAVPQFSGLIRLMAVAYKNDAFGSAESFITIADPLVVSAALPRFLSPKDTVTVPVMLSNTTDKDAIITASIKTEGPLKATGETTVDVPIKAKSESTATFKLIADLNVGEAKVTIKASGMGETFSEVTDISVRPTSPLQKRHGGGFIAANTTGKVNMEVDNFVNTGYQLVVSKSPVLEFAHHLSELVRYPYGCTEQTVSAAFPQLYFADLSVLFNQDTLAAKNANNNIMEAIKRLKLRQLYNGGFSLWDGYGNEQWWASVYATHFLLEARKAGFEVDKSVIDYALNYIEFRLKKREWIPYWYNRDQNRKIAPREVAYGLFVLSLAGRPQANTMNYYKSNSSQLTADSRYMLAAAFALAGDKNAFYDLLPNGLGGEVSNTETGGSFASSLRDEAISLYVLLEVDPDNAQIPLMAKHVSEELKKNRWYSTQERAFSFLSLGKLARKANQSNVTATIKVNGKVVGEFKDKPVRLTDKKLGSPAAEISVSGNGNLYYFWQSEGLTPDGSYKQEDSYIKVRKAFYDRFGNPIKTNSFKQNDLIIVQLTLQNSYNTSVENIVITDMLPAGFEIENPRTQEIPGMQWIKNATHPTALDVRDDRINYFVDLWNANPQYYYYAVRAVSPGIYQMGPVSADAMYNGEYHSYNGAGVVRVVR